MTLSALILASLVQVQVPVVVVEDPAADYVVVQAHIKRPQMEDGRLQAAWFVIGKVLLKGAEGYSENTIRAYGGQTGRLPSVTVFPDHMRVEVAAPEGGLNVSLELMSAILKSARLRDADLIQAIKEGQGSEISLGNAMGFPFRGRYERLSAGYIRQVFDNTFNPKNAVLSIGGSVTEYEAHEAVRKYLGSWRKRSVARIPRRQMLEPVLSLPGKASFFGLQAKPIRVEEAGASATLLAVYALGVGKGAAAFQTWRQDKGWSYDQGATLWPTMEGLTPILYLLQRSGRSDGSLIAEMREELLSAVEEWDEGDLLRAQSLAIAGSYLSNPPSPFLAAPDRRLGYDISDQCAWQGYLALSGSGAVQMQTVLSAMQNVDLEELKSAAKSMIEESRGTWLPGKNTGL